MERKQQIAIVTKLGESVIKQIVGDIEAGKVPQEWDGVELRQWMADRFAYQTLSTMMTRGRKRDYNNTVLVNNL